MSRRNTTVLEPSQYSNARATDGVDEILQRLWGTAAAYPDEPAPTLPITPRPGALELGQHGEAAAAPAAAGGGEGGGLLEVLAGLNISLGAFNQHQAAQAARPHNWRRRPSIPLEYCHPLDFTPDQLKAAGTLDVPDKFGPKTGWIWHITRLSVVGLTGSSVNNPVPAQPAVPASTVAAQNVNLYEVQVVISAGTLTSVVVNGIQVGTAAGTYVVPAGGAISITYTVAPTWVWTYAPANPNILAGGTTTLSVYKDSPADPSMLLNTVTGAAGPVNLIWEPRLLLLIPNRKLVFTGAGGGYTVNGEGVEIAMPWIAEYLL